MKKQLIAGILALALMLTTAAAAASAADIDIAPSAAQVDAGLVAADYAPVGSELEPSSPLPASYSSLELGYTTPVRSQNYNTCWAYSATAVMEVLLNKLGIGSVQFSPMDINYRSVKKSDGTGWQRSYTSAGYPYIALGCLTSTGAVKESDLPDSTFFSNYAQLSGGLEPYAYAESIIYLKSGDIDSVKTAVYNYGAAVGNFHYSASLLNDDTSAYYCDIDYIATSNLYGHAVAIVGWDDDYDPENFLEEHRPSEKGAWLCKNSWGTMWSNMDGYFWISYEDKHLFDFRFGPSYAISGVVLASDDLRIKQNELYGATYEFNYPETYDRTIRSLTYANITDFSDGYRVIDKVTFESTAEGSAYDVFYIPINEDGVPTADESEWVLLYSDTIAHEGYICADIEDYTVSADKGAVGIRITREDASGSIAIGTDEWLATSSKYIFIPEITGGVSYVMGYREEAYDLMDYFRDQLYDNVGGTFVIKVQTHPEPERLLGDVDGDGAVTVIDATWIQRYLADIIDFDDVQTAVADYDRDGIITILDATAIQRYLAGL